MIVYTRSLSSELYGKMKEFIPDDIHCVQVPGFNRSEDCSNYLHYIITNSPDEWVINVDEDCFIYNWQGVLDLIETMKNSGSAYCGMPDGGICSTRARSWIAMNPFFNIFNVNQIIDKYTSREEIDKTVVSKVILDIKPDFILGEYDNTKISPFNGIFNWLFTNFIPTYLLADNHEDGISTILKGMTIEPFALHSWYSREYNNDPLQKKRIDNLYKEAKHLRN